jgi:hypothetical protein
MDTGRRGPYPLKYISFIILVSLVIGQEKKINFDPNKLNDPEPRWPKIILPLSVDSQFVKKDTVDTAEIIVEGFRVQVLATRDRGNAERLQNELLLTYNEDIYIIFEAPNYKVRMGNFFDRRHAESFRKTFVKKGYPSAWIIRTRIDPKIK